ncbi:PIN domain protein [Candidatus Electronema sp. PJ]|uniref:PIN domain protein n=1 Tax=Candidatus Electronema sp. PJ TaxID=3401572 RepID=UPI003AA7D6D4
MKIQRIYVDTSVIGGCFDPEFTVWSNGLMNDFKFKKFKPVISEIVSEEIVEAPTFVREKYAELINIGAECLEVNEEALNLLAQYQIESILTEKYRNDMVHIALATIAGVDLLTSWNFKHIVRFDKIRAFNAVNIASGYKTVEIYSPREVTTYETD